MARSKRAAKAKAAKEEAEKKAANEVAEVAEKVEKIEISDRACTGNLVSHRLSRDIKVEQFSLSFRGTEMIVDTNLELNYGRRYGLLGPNGSGKTMLLSSLGKREAPLPDHIDCYQLTAEVAPSDDTALDVVMEHVEVERARLEKEAEALLEIPDGAECEALHDIYERLDELDYEVAKKKAISILRGLGFNTEMQAKKTRDFSGGWRMRISLAKALFINPTLLLLDEPTNHLDLEACVWLEEYLKGFTRILVIVSHSQDFLNGVCTNIIDIQDKKLLYYGGNYDIYVRTKAELEENQMKRYKWEQDQISHMKEYIARFGHGSAKLAKQAQSKEKTLAKMVEGGLTEKVQKKGAFDFKFSDCGTLPPPVLMFQNVTFGYDKSKGPLYEHLDLGVDLDSRVVLVGPNGAGKSTLLKLMVGELQPWDGMVRRHTHLRIARYHQHLAEQLDLELSPVEYMRKCFPEAGSQIERYRSMVGRFGITGKTQMMPMQDLSDGLRSRVVFAWLAWSQPHMLLLDEPTNHLDIETIDALARALNSFEGGMVLVSHDFRLINQVAKEIWLCEGGKIKKWKGDIVEYKAYLKRRMEADQ
eukprot:CAMPEP_0113886474 /NCGR_PEP_ID=MMETSP0780_2-20120614/11574_1 /TAXON_ID=652834 /ORGANISM="Palpitomonas bilix" /LENGTH=586 /DNA_ID=CAMNT_0000874691 /DNA_START=42 /DNA_END=1802 /DNA_ORIENTATION=- /assembly_acc=CAM_ASM_000599